MFGEYRATFGCSNAVGTDWIIEAPK
jgi:hypothetical protein